jgi:hypothetical protein
LPGKSDYGTIWVLSLRDLAPICDTKSCHNRVLPYTNGLSVPH